MRMKKKLHPVMEQLVMVLLFMKNIVVLSWKVQMHDLNMLG